MHARDLIPILKQAAIDWVEDGAMRLSSSLAYYAIFSLAPTDCNRGVIPVRSVCAFRRASGFQNLGTRIVLIIALPLRA